LIKKTLNIAKALFPRFINFHQDFTKFWNCSQNRLQFLYCSHSIVSIGILELTQHWTSLLFIPGQNWSNSYKEVINLCTQSIYSCYYDYSKFYVGLKNLTKASFCKMYHINFFSKSDPR
jgi:hypothetical protein